MMLDLCTIPMPIVGQNNELIIAYEMEDISPRYHLLQKGMPGHCPPHPEIGDVVMVKDSNSNPPSFPLAVVKSVSRPKFTIDSRQEEESARKAIAIGPILEQDYFVGQVELSMLQVVAQLPGGYKRYKASEASNTRSWHCLERLVCDAQLTCHENKQVVEWL